MDMAQLSMAMTSTEVLPKFHEHMGLNLAMVGGGADDSEIDKENDDNNMTGEGVRTEGAGRPGESARGGAARQGTHAEK
jgi:hypothetical protein